MAESALSLWVGDEESAAEIARAVNAAICELEERLDRGEDDEHRVGFLCECGCLSIAAMTMAEYRLSGGAWIDGHQKA